MANYKKHKARQHSRRCTLCKYHKKIGNSKEHLSHKYQVLASAYEHYIKNEYLEQ